MPSFGIKSNVFALIECRDRDMSMEETSTAISSAQHDRTLKLNSEHHFETFPPFHGLTE